MIGVLPDMPKLALEMFKVTVTIVAAGIFSSPTSGGEKHTLRVRRDARRSQPWISPQVPSPSPKTGRKGHTRWNVSVRASELTSGELTKRFRFILCTHLAAALLMLAPQSLQAAAGTTFLHTQGQDIVNARGEKILLRGVGLGNWMLPEGYMWKFGGQGDRPPENRKARERFDRAGERETILVRVSQTLHQ